MLPRGLERATVTPGSIAPDASVTVPPIAPTPCAAAGAASIQNDHTRTPLRTKSLTLIVTPPLRRLAKREQPSGPFRCAEHTPALSNGRSGDERVAQDRRAA